MDCRSTNLECCWSCWDSYEDNRLTIIRFHCAFEKSGTYLFVWEVKHDFSLSLGPLRKICILLVFLYVSLHLCSSCTMLYCTLLYGIDLCSKHVHICNSPENSCPAFSCFCIRHTQCICCISGFVMTLWCIVFQILQIHVKYYTAFIVYFLQYDVWYPAYSCVTCDKL